MGTNYALETGIRSVPGAITFACIHTVLLGWFTYMSFRNPVHVHFALVGYCVLNVVAYSLRAVLASSDAYGQNLDMLNAEQILFTIGFLILLYTSHTLVLDLEKQSLPSDRPVLDTILVRLLGSHRVFHFCLLAAVALTIAAGVTSNGTDFTSPSEELHIASSVLFFVLTLFQAFQTAVYASMELNQEHRSLRKNDPFGKKYAVFILLAIALFFLITEIFEMVTIHDYDKGNNEDFLYPLVALPELLAVLLYAIPDLVPAVCPSRVEVSVSSWWRRRRERRRSRRRGRRRSGAVEEVKV